MANQAHIAHTNSKVFHQTVNKESKQTNINVLILKSKNKNPKCEGKM